MLTRVKYTIVRPNTSKVTAKNVTLRDTLPSGLSFAKSSRLGTLATGRISFTLGTLKAGESRTVSVWLVANASVRGKRTNTATAQATGVAAVRANAVTDLRADREAHPAGRHRLMIHPARAPAWAPGPGRTPVADTPTSAS